MPLLYRQMYINQIIVKSLYMSLSYQSEIPSLLTEPQCDCCDDQSECMSTTASNFDYDADYVEISSSSDSDGPPLNISVQIGHRPNSKVINSRLPHARRGIRCCRLLVCLSCLAIIYV